MQLFSNLTCPFAYGILQKRDDSKGYFAVRMKKEANEKLVPRMGERASLWKDKPSVGGASIKRHSPHAVVSTAAGRPVCFNNKILHWNLRRNGTTKDDRQGTTCLWWFG